MTSWNIKLLTIFPEIFPGPLSCSLAGKAMDKGIFTLEAINIRDYSYDKHQAVDDKVFGGGAGMLMRPDVIGNAIEACLSDSPQSKLVYFTPRGKQFNQTIARELIESENIIMLCGRYEGIDQRIFDKYDFEEYSLGDYVLSGGEIAALTVIDACVRLIPGVIDNNKANDEESFSEGEYQKLLEYDQYTRPVSWDNREVPDILLSGNHKEISKWRKKNAIEKTTQLRPDLFKA